MKFRTLPIRRKRLRVCFLACLTASLIASTHLTTAAPGGSANTVTLNFVDADITAVVQAIAKISGRNFIVDPRVKGSINIVTAAPVDKDLTYSILLSALRLQGYTAVEEKTVTKIVPEADAKLHASPVGSRGKGGDRMATRVFVLKHESAQQIAPIIRPLVSPNNIVAAYPGNNTLVVTDYAENLERIAQIVESIDLPQGDVRIMPLKHASAADLAATINRLMNDATSGGAPAGAASVDSSQRVVVIAEMRTNSLLVRSDNPSKINAVRQLVGNLDQPGAAGNIHVVYLKNAEAIRVAQILRSVLSGETTSPLAPSTSQGFAPSGMGGGLASPGGAGGAGSSSGPSLSGPAISAPVLASTAGSVNQGQGGGIVQADPMSNSLIITAPEAIYNNLRRVVDQLDRRRAQVYIEALIAEISTEKAAEIGIQWQATSGKNVYGGTNFSSGGNNILTLATGLLNAASPTLPGTGLNMILGSGTMSIAGKQIANLNVLARFLESDGRANILSTPNIVTLDNEEAKIVVGRNLPFVTGQYTTSTGGGTTVGNPFQTIERRDVGVMLKVKPQISEGGTVKLQIYQEASSVSSAVGIPGLSENSGPVTNKRSIESTVLIEDGAMVALGGLVEDAYSKDAEKVPVLGDAPLIGGLFRYDTSKRAKTNMIVFLRPVVLRDGASYQGISNDRYDYIVGQQSAINAGQGINGPTIPDLRKFGGRESPPANGMIEKPSGDGSGAPAAQPSSAAQGLAQVSPVPLQQPFRMQGNGLDSGLDGVVYVEDQGRRRGIGNALVELVDPSGKVAATARSNEDGRYVIEAIPPGPYLARISADQLKQMKFGGDRERSVELPPNGGFVNGVDFVLRR